jgi:hypothetical protein
MLWNDEDNLNNFLFSEGYLAHFDFRGKLKIVLDLINETSEEDVFGETVVKWRITEEGRKLVRKIATDLYKENQEKSVLDESDEKNIYKSMVIKYLEACLNHEEFIIKRGSASDIRRLKLRNPQSGSQVLYGVSRIHDSGIATYIGLDPDDLYADDDKERGELLITTEEAVLQIIAHCNIVVTAEVDHYKTTYFVSPSHLLPSDLSDDYNIIVRK